MKVHFPWDQNQSSFVSLQGNNFLHNENGFKCKKLVPQTIEDSGFGVAQILILASKEAENGAFGASRSCPAPAHNVGCCVRLGI